MSTRWTTVLDGARLRELRRCRGLSRAELGRRAGVSPATVARLEREKNAPCRNRTLARLAAALGEDSNALTPRDPLPLGAGPAGSFSG